jgi:hypothetical protein
MVLMGAQISFCCSVEFRENSQIARFPWESLAYLDIFGGSGIERESQLVLSLVLPGVCGAGDKMARIRERNAGQGGTAMSGSLFFCPKEDLYEVVNTH